ncbi:hypothetical protein C8E97_3747 [Saccharothrix australiensis]|uniref:Uncharacterized protein n=1 Tax=Saccharothrix australiensis TaxID=2072 RepID=A0A495W071_9PSEU|nr:hypothetical protein C8E97_3747 [Saccharothrix australiensis]
MGGSARRRPTTLPDKPPGEAAARPGGLSGGIGELGPPRRHGVGRTRRGSTNPVARQASSCLGSDSALIAILRGLARSATGIRSVSTPAS